MRVSVMEQINAVRYVASDISDHHEVLLSANSWITLTAPLSRPTDISYTSASYSNPAAHPLISRPVCDVIAHSV